MAEISGVSGPSSSVSSAPSPASTSDSGASSVETETAASSAVPSTQTSTIERAEQVQISSSVSAASHEALIGDSAQSDPENSREVAAVQAEVAEAVTGAPEPGESDVEAEAPAVEEEPPTEMTEDEKARLDEYEEARALLDSYNPITALGASDEVQMKLREAEEIVYGNEEEYATHLDQLQATFSELDKQVTYQTSYLDNEGQMLTSEELALAQEFTGTRVSEAMAPFEDATRAMLETVREPAFQAYLRDLEPEDQQRFFDDMARYMPASETGREWLGEFADGLADLGRQGDTANLTAEVAAALREALEPEEQLKLDSNLGVMVGADLASRPQDGDQRLLDIADALGLPESQREALRHPETSDFDQVGRFGQSVGTSFEIFESMNRQIPGTDLFAETSTNLSYVGMGVGGVKRLSDLARSSRVVGAALGLTDDGLGRIGSGLQGLGRAISVASLGFSAASVAHQLSQGNHEAAFDGALGLAGGAAASFGTGGVALAGYALIGASMALPHLRESADYQHYVTETTQAALGDAALDSLRGEMITYSPSYGAYVLDQLRPPDMSIADYLNSRVQSFNPDATGASQTIWGFFQSELGDLQLQQAEAAATARLTEGL